MNDQAKITFMLEDGKEESFEVLEETKINGINYLLIASEEDEAMILKEDSVDGDALVYVPIEDEEELKAISKVFSELLEDVDFE